MSDQIGPLTSVLLFTTPERYAKMHDFYVDTVGLVPSSDGRMRVAFDWKSGDLRTRLILSTHDGVDGMTGDPYRIMINFQVDDIRAVAKRLTGAGLDFIRQPSQEAWGGWIATFDDPDGNLIQLLQPIE